MSQNEWDFLESHVKAQVINDDAIFVVWTTEDVIGRAADSDIELTQEEARSILAEVDHRHDANYGINWGTLDYYINEAVSASIREGSIEGGILSPCTSLPHEKA